eukprot:2731676-Prymnesium_polylepis.1
MHVLVGQLVLSAPPAPPALLLSDRTGSVRLRLPEDEMAHPQLKQMLGAVVALSRFHLLLTPSPIGGPPSLSLC